MDRQVAIEPTDTDEVRLRKTVLSTITMTILPAAIIWSFIYLIFSEPIAALFPTIYALLSIVNFYVFSKNHRYEQFRFSQLFILLLAPFLVLLALGGFANSGGIILWCLLTPLCSLLLAEPRQASRWFLAFLGVVVLSVVLQPYLRASNNLPPIVISLFFIMNVGAVSSIAFLMLRYFLSQRLEAYRLLSLEQEKSENLLLNILPKEITTILKGGRQTIADNFGEASILFADMVNFTPLTDILSPVEMVDLLNEVFTYFDLLVDKYEVEKICTIGDNYMVASGVPRPRRDHAQALANMALDIRDFIRTLPPHGGRHLDFRIGIDSGPVVAGIIGRKKFIYDLWGDAVNTASRMESHGTPGRIQITRATYELLKDEFVCEPRGTIPVKGKGDMETWYLADRKPISCASDAR